MATVATSMYSTHQHSFLPQSGRATTSNISQVQPAQQEDPSFLEGEFTTLLCRALYDYDAQDASALSFRRNDIIEVLTQQPSGWWDGLLGDERGWFPSNYVTVISDEEAELAFPGTYLSNPEGGLADTHGDTSMVDMSHAILRGSNQAENEAWLDGETVPFSNDPLQATHVAANGPTQSSDFWMPEVTPDGQIYYVNTKTGQHARDLPQEADDEVSDSELAGLTSQSSSRSGASASLAFGPNATVDEAANDYEIAGFGIPRRTGTPEPWVKKLADDGMSYYYYNKHDGKVSWTRPEAPSVPPTLQNSASESSLSSSQSRRPNANSRLSAYSDDSDIHPIEPLRIARGQTNGDPSPEARNPLLKGVPNEHTILEYEAAERIARSLQQALSPPPPELVTELSAATKAAIQAVINNIQLIGLARRSEEDRRMDDLIFGVVLAVRNLLYVSAIPTTQIPVSVLPRELRDAAAAAAASSGPSPLKPAQRKVTATLSRLVLSARAMQYDSGSVMADTLNRIEVDAEELERAVLSFVLEVQRNQHTARPDANPLKRLHGVFSAADIGLGLVGAGAAGCWKGFGWVSLDDRHSPRRVLGPEAITEMNSYLESLERQFTDLVRALQVSGEGSVEQVRLYGRALITQISSFLVFISDIHVARHVDIDGVHHENGSSSSDPYSQTVENARLLVRTLETVVQSIFDDCSNFLLALQSIRDSELDAYRHEREYAYDHVDALASSLGSNLRLVIQTLDSILTVGHNQAEMAQGDYSGSIDWRMSRISVRPIPEVPRMDDGDDGDLVDIAMALGKPVKTPESSFKVQHRKNPNGSDATFHSSQASHDDRGPGGTSDNTLVLDESADGTLVPEFGGGPFLDDDDPLVPSKSPPRPSYKLQRLLGDEYAEKMAADLRPWYLRPNYNPTEILIDPDNSIRGGTVPALIERLTAHEQTADRTFTKAFLMTYKSFTTLDEFFDLLIARFRIQPPANLTSSEHEEWSKLKQNVIQIRVLNTFKAMIVDGDVLEKEDMYILDRMKAFVSSPEASHIAAAKQLMILIDRAQRGDDSVKTHPNNQGAPPPSIMPKTTKKLKLGDIEPLELARQLTIYESQLYQKIKPIECLQRAREQRTDSMDNIAIVIQTSNRIADWVAESVLSKEDSRKRANAVKQLILVADRCRTLNNFSTMIAITSGLNTPPIRRLKRTWEQVNQRCMAQFGACEMTIDSNKNFTKYRQLMASVTPPCVPFIGVFLSTLQFIQDGNPDLLPGGLINFRKRQKASEVINDIKRWQAQPFNFTPIPAVLSYIEESLGQFSDTRASSEHFWALSLEREPREREDEKMARLLQESGFL
ncbi:ras guanine nucleotide exchange factor domain-containing protein [Collybia nuda]|uniref:Ras guanine nucleotide exchange factor domain-containing protein n=1 Tax=Collybia nuda TaxID=64659 RepID=A0A9P5Y8C4_9AGAR|nr:ras guanine nucleotide exchange factor domain-containing protein [Collybia nuda]